MSGSAGHLKNVWEVRDLTFGDLEKIIKKSLNGKLKAVEKLDGQNLMISFNKDPCIPVGPPWDSNYYESMACGPDYTICMARTTSHLKNYGENALIEEGIKDYFKDKESIRDTFYAAIKALDNSDLNKRIFKDGIIWLNLEIIDEHTENIIPYHKRELRLHNFQEVNEDGKVIKIFKNRYLRKFSNISNGYLIKPTNNVKIKKIPFFGPSLLYELNGLKNLFGLTNKNTIRDYIAKCVEMILNFEGISKENIEDFKDRWAYGNKSIHINHLLNKIENKKAKKIVRDYNREIESRIKDDFIAPIENLFLRLGSLVLDNTEEILVSYSKEYATSIIKNKTNDALKKLKENYNNQDFIIKQNRRLEICGGLNAISPIEGIVFEYKNHLLKLTGCFAPVNQIIGKVKYN